MKVVVRNELAGIKAYSHMPQTYEFEGEVVATPKWVPYEAIALTTGNKSFPIRIIDRSNIISMDEEIVNRKKQVDTKKVFVVKGSKGNEYVVTVEGTNKSCTCQAFMYRRSCRHIAEAV
jgi:hypothetical protein